MPEINIMVLTISDKEEDLFNSVKAGARGYMVKQQEPEQIAQAVQHIASGGVIVSARMATTLLKELKTQQSGPFRSDSTSVSQQEREILQLLAFGASDKDIASQLSISEKTLKTLLRSILDKLHLFSRSK